MPDSRPAASLDTASRGRRPSQTTGSRRWREASSRWLCMTPLHLAPRTANTATLEASARSAPVAR